MKITCRSTGLHPQGKIVISFTYTKMYCQLDLLKEVAMNLENEPDEDSIF